MKRTIIYCIYTSTDRHPSREDSLPPPFLCCDVVAGRYCGFIIGCHSLLTYSKISSRHVGVCSGSFHVLGASTNGLGVPDSGHLCAARLKKRRRSRAASYNGDVGGVLSINLPRKTLFHASSEG
jgi:hypothetical protein